jgi:hypothetical protein
MSARWNRRRMLGATLGVAGASWLGGLAPRAAAGGTAPTGAGSGGAGAPAAARLVVVHDGRFESSRRHADRLAWHAHRTIDAREDLARLWYRELRLEAARTPLAFAGLTTWSDYVVLQGCAAEAGLRESRYELVRDAGGRGCTLVRWQIGGTST